MVKQITFISGKGGTGKTSLVASFAQLAQNIVIADCDVDASNLHLVIESITYRNKPEIVRSGFEMILDPEACTSCEECSDVCRFDALFMEEFPDYGNALMPVFDKLTCEGCGVCADVCPVEAIGLQEKEIGLLFSSTTRFGSMAHSRLNIAESNSGKLVTMVRNKASELAEKEQRSMLLIDGSPGIGCPVIASLTGVDYVVIVTEATMSGLHDLSRIIELCQHFKITPFLIINKYDINEDVANSIENEAAKQNVLTLGKIPFSKIVTEAMVKRQTVLEYAPESPLSTIIKEIWRKFQENMN